MAGCDLSGKVVILGDPGPYAFAGMTGGTVYQMLTPHLGFAYRAFDGRKSFVIRGGYSMSYFPLPMWGWSDRMRMNAPFVGTYENRYNSAATYSPDGIGNYGMRSIPSIIAGQNSADAINPASPTGIEIGGDAFMASYWAPNQPTPMVQDWSFTVEKEIMKDTMVRAAYVGNHASNQELYDSYNMQIPAYTWLVNPSGGLVGGETAADVLRRLDASERAARETEALITSVV